MKNKISGLTLVVLFLLVGRCPVNAQSTPLVLGRGIERFEVGEVLHQDDFDDLDDWVVQIEQRDGFPEPHVEAKDQTLDARVPGRGCTIWFKEKLKNRLTITYEVVCPDANRGRTWSPTEGRQQFLAGK